MAIASSGAVSASDIRSEYGLTGAVSFSSLYRGGSHIRAKAANNTATNLASSVPTSGTITFDNFRGTAKGFRYTFTAGATDQNASALFGSDYGVSYPKEIVINSGVELGATSTSEEALEIDSGGAGTITITNNGTLTGAGGAAGADGGDAFEAATNCVLLNNGTIRAGGGGGGNGGNGQYQSGTSGNLGWGYGLAWNNCTISCTSRHGSTAFCASGCSHYSPPCCYQCNVCKRPTYTSTTGGSGGVGAGYGQSAGTGAAGSGQNAGTGGNGGAFGASATSGANGTITNGAAGGAGGAYIRGNSFVTLTNNGTLTGSVV